MTKVIDFLALILVIQQVTGQQTQAQCTFELINSAYTCRLVDQNILNEGNLQQLVFLHETAFDDDDVHTLTETNSIINVFPSLLINRFVTLSNIMLTGVQMKQFVSPIRNCENLSVLFLDFNEIATINGGNFVNCSKLVYFSLTESGVESIHEGAFSGLMSLKFLSLSGNNIETIDPTVFAPLSHLAILELSENNIIDLGYSSFQFMPVLTQLALDGNQLTSWNSSILPNHQQLSVLRLDGNKINNINVNTFSRLPNLITLLIGDNFETVPTLENPGQLLDLTFSKNPIREVKAISFQNLRTLERLYLDYCQIENVDFDQDDGTFLQELRILSLTNNKITNLHAYAFSMLATLEALFLNGNQIQRLNANAIRPIMQMRVLDVSRNQINIVEREIFDGARNLTFKATGNICVNSDVTVLNSAQFDRDIVPVIIKCLNSANASKVKIILLASSAILVIFSRNF